MLRMQRWRPLSNSQLAQLWTWRLCTQLWRRNPLWSRLSRRHHPSTVRTTPVHRRLIQLRRVFRLLRRFNQSWSHSAVTRRPRRWWTPCKVCHGRRLRHHHRLQARVVPGSQHRVPPMPTPAPAPAPRPHQPAALGCAHRLLVAPPPRRLCPKPRWHGAGPRPRCKCSCARRSPEARCRGAWVPWTSRRWI